MKKSSLALLMAVLVLLTAVLVGSMVTASAEDVVEPEATLYKADGKTVQAEGTLVECIKAGYGLTNTTNYKLVLHKDAELTEAGLLIKSIAEFDGQGYTVYVDDSINVEASKNFFNITHQGTTTFKNINFVGQDMDWDGTVANMKTFSTSNNYSGAIQVPAGIKFVMEDCTMTAFRTLGRASAIYAVISGLTEYSNDNGIWLIDTEIVGNYSVGAAAGGTSVAVNVPPSGSGAWGNVLHVSGNTVVKDNYDMNGSAAANIYVLKTTAMTGTESSVLMVEEDFTGTVGMIVNQSINNQAGRRGAVFFAGETYDASNTYTRKGVVFANAGDSSDGKIYIQAQGASNTYQYFIADVVADDTTSPYGFFAISGGLGGNMSTLTDTVKLTVMDKAGTKELFTMETSIKNGDILSLPTWATWTDAKWGLTPIVHANGADYVGKVNYDTGFLYSTTAAGTSWTYSADFTPANTYKIIEALGDYELTATPSTGYNSTLIIDFNGYTLTRADKSYNLKWEGTSSGSATQNITIRNMVFDGTIDGVVPTDANTLIRGYKYATMTLENCEFKNIITTDSTSNTYSSYAAVIMANATSSITLKDVTATNCKGHQGVVYAGAIPVYLAGDTRIGEVVDGAFVAKTALSCYAVGTSVAVIETFTGECYLSLEGYGTANQPVYFKSSSVTATDEMKAKAFVAEGALILGRIAPSGDPTGYFAYNNGGTLSWTKPGNALAGGSVSYDAATNTLTGSSWFYNDGTKDVPTTVIVADVFNYFQKDLDASTVEAINSTTLVYGDLADVIAAATAGQTVEVLKDVTGINNLTISTAITLDGNGKTLTWRTSPDPVAEADTTACMIKVTVAGALLKDVTLHGGAAEKAVWDGPLAPIGARMFVHTAPTTLQNVVLTGARIEAASRDDGMILGYSSSVLTLVDVTVTDNIVKLNNATVYNAAGHLMRQGSDANPTTMSGKMVFKENYRIISDGAVYQDNFFINNPKRVTVGQLTEGSEVHTFWASSYTPLLNAYGKPFNNTGYFYADNASTKMTATTNDDGSISISGNSSWCADLAYDGTTMALVSANKVTLGETVTTQGAITTDKFELNYKPTVEADYYGTDVVVKIGNKEVARNNLSTYTPAASVITVEAIVGMAELTDVITLEFQDATTKEALASWTTTAKTYANGLIDAATGVTVEQKTAIASLLQYGAMVQTYFGYNVDDLAMTTEEKATWTAAGYITDLAECDIDTSASTVKSSVSGSVSGLTFGGVALTMENQMSLRLYLVASDIDALTATVNDAAVEIERDAQGYYVEASNIGTAKLAEAVTFVITDGNTSVTVTASPMTYVYNVLTITHDSITEDLRNACEALYYYYAAAAACFDFTDATGFVAAVGTMVTALDTPNAFGAPYGI